MLVKDFINEFKNKRIQNSKTQPDAVNEYIKHVLEVKDYVPFADKRELCKIVLDATCTKDGGIVKSDGLSRYILFTLSMLTKYTNLTFENDDDLDSMDQYDLLCQNNLLDPILECIGEEYSRCNNILNMMLADVIENNNNIAVVVDGAAQKLLGIIDGFVDVLKDKVDDLELDLNQLNIDKYMPLLEKMAKK